MISTAHAMHALGWLCIATFTGAGALSAYAIAATCAGQWRRILRLVTGHVEQPVAALFPRAASVAPAATRLPCSRAIEGDAELQGEVVA